ncbi:hypothetical protein Tco_0721509 [Tanacetum coccineum]
MENLSQKHGLVSRTYSKKSLIMASNSGFNIENACATIEKLAQYEDEGWNDPVIPDEVSLDYENPNIELLLGVMEYKVDALMKDVISLMGRSEGIFRMTTSEMYQLPPVPSSLEEFEHTVMNFILD